MVLVDKSAYSQSDKALLFKGENGDQKGHLQALAMDIVFCCQW